MIVAVLDVVLVESSVVVVVVALSVVLVAVVVGVVVVVFTLEDALWVVVIVCFSCSVVEGVLAVDLVYDVLGGLGAEDVVGAWVVVGNCRGKSLMQKTIY